MLGGAMGRFTALLLAGTLMAVGALAETSAHTGTWKLDAAQSRFSGGITLKSLTERIVLDAERYQIHGTGVGADGKPFTFRIHIRFDGKDYPVTGLGTADAAQAKWSNDHKPVLIEKKNGKQTVVITCDVSADGKTRSCILKGEDPTGKPVDSETVFTRVG